MSKRAPESSKFAGVTKDSRVKSGGKQWQIRIRRIRRGKDRKEVLNKYFYSEVDAAKAYDLKKIEMGEFDGLNFYKYPDELPSIGLKLLEVGSVPSLSALADHQAGTNRTGSSVEASPIKAKYKGSTFVQGMYQSRIRFQGKLLYLGVFSTDEAAGRVAQLVTQMIAESGTFDPALFKHVIDPRRMNTLLEAFPESRTSLQLGAWIPTTSQQPDVDASDGGGSSASVAAGKGKSTSTAVEPGHTSPTMEALTTPTPQLPLVLTSSGILPMDMTLSQSPQRIPLQSSLEMGSPPGRIDLTNVEGNSPGPGAPLLPQEEEMGSPPGRIDLTNVEGNSPGPGAPLLPQEEEMGSPLDRPSPQLAEVSTARTSETARASRPGGSTSHTAGIANTAQAGSTRGPPTGPMKTGMLRYFSKMGTAATGVARSVKTISPRKMANKVGRALSGCRLPFSKIPKPDTKQDVNQAATQAAALPEAALLQDVSGEGEPQEGAAEGGEVFSMEDIGDEAETCDNHDDCTLEQYFFLEQEINGLRVYVRELELGQEFGPLSLVIPILFAGTRLRKCVAAMFFMKSGQPVALYALSGWGHRDRPYVNPAIDDAIRLAKKLGCFRPHTLFDKGKPGQFAACHAEIQLFMEW
eukprot:CAMPEP_0198228662 /NCGR_PEP_ID=MMETSP1445-20131203/113714_1 /TAXON_ID=36898 /ORGANISM="Pyramimonas sp., Strain CCMP2087" /LENGTH=634 /DNA_ID=CAMNT_0043909077 /DNA_START=56 /DNA_END=1957 /DNA_ORIENTATION=+